MYHKTDEILFVLESTRSIIVVACGENTLSRSLRAELPRAPKFHQEILNRAALLFRTDLCDHRPFSRSYSCSAVWPQINTSPATNQARIIAANRDISALNTYIGWIMLVFCFFRSISFHRFALVVYSLTYRTE